MTLRWNVFYSVSMALNACWASVQWIVTSYIIGPINIAQQHPEHVGRVSRKHIQQLEGILNEHIQHVGAFGLACDVQISLHT